MLDSVFGSLNDGGCIGETMHVRALVTPAGGFEPWHSVPNRLGASAKVLLTKEFPEPGSSLAVSRFCLGSGFPKEWLVCRVLQNPTSPHADRGSTAVRGSSSYPAISL